MKRFVTLLAVLLASVSVAHAQFGVVGGFTSSYTSLDNKTLDNIKNVSLFHAGVAYKIKMGPLFALQPGLSYQMKGATMQEMISSVDISTLNTKSGFVELSLGAQLGVDLLVFRPFLLVEPFVGYQVYSYTDCGGSLSLADCQAYLNDAKNKLEVGFGVGGGVELLNHLQLSVQWFMNAGQLYSDEQLNADAIRSVVASNYKDIKNYQGIKVSLGIFF